MFFEGITCFRQYACQIYLLMNQLLSVLLGTTNMMFCIDPVVFLLSTHEIVFQIVLLQYSNQTQPFVFQQFRGLSCLASITHYSKNKTFLLESEVHLLSRCFKKLLSWTSTLSVDIKVISSTYFRMIVLSWTGGLNSY